MLKKRINLRNVATLAACLAVSMMMFSGCDKDNPNSPDDPEKPEIPGNSSTRLVSYLFTSERDVSDCTYNYEYDSQNRLSKITAAGGANAGVWNVTYPTASTIRYQNGDKYQLLTKNSQGYVTNFESNNPMSITQVLEYENGYLSKTTTVAMGITTINNYTWSNGILNVIEQRMSGIVVKKSTFSYNTTANKECYISPWVTSHQGNWYSPTSFCGKMSPNLASSEAQEMIMMGTTNITYRYETDAQGYVTKVHVKEGSGSESLLYEVRYK
jgi:hypothetical protein